MVLLAHYNPSTLKAAYRSSNQKQIVTNVYCSHCSPSVTPYQLDITFSNPTYCTACCTVYSTSYKIINHGNIVSTFRIKFIKQLGDEYTTCKWEGIFTGSYGTHYQYNNNYDCSGAPTITKNLNELFIQIIKDGSPLTTIGAWVYDSSIGMGTGNQFPIANIQVYTPTSGCLNKSGLNSINTCCTASGLAYTSSIDIDIAEV